MQQVPNKSQFKVGEVCQIADTQPYVLRFWENEFPQLRPQKSRGGQSVYTKSDLRVVLTIKRLLDEEEYTIADARDRLDDALKDAPKPAASAAKAPAKKKPAPKATPRPAPKRVKPAIEERDLFQEAGASSVVADPAIEDATENVVLRDRVEELKQRYEAACTEIVRLKADLSGTDDAYKANEALRRQADALQERLIEFEGMEKDLAESKVRIHELEARLGSRERPKREIKQQLQDVNDELKKANKERQTLLEARGQQEKSLDTIRAKLETVERDRNAERRRRERVAAKLETVLEAFHALVGDEPRRS